MSVTTENTNYSSYNSSINNLRNIDNFKTVLFSSFVKKINRYNKSADRVIVLTDTAIYKLDGPKSKFKNMKSILYIREVI